LLKIIYVALIEHPTAWVSQLVALVGIITAVVNIVTAEVYIIRVKFAIKLLVN